MTLIQEVKTRWNATYFSIDRLIVLRSYISADLAQYGGVKAHKQLTPPEWSTLIEMREVLKPFQQASEAIEGEKYPTLSLTNGLFRGIMRALERLMNLRLPVDRVARDLMLTLHRELTRRSAQTMTDLKKMAEILDPRTKRHANTLHWEKLPKFVRTYVDPAPNNSEKPAVPELNGDIYYDLEIITEQTNLEKEIASYRAEPELPLFTASGGYSDPMAYWKERKDQLPELSQIAELVLSVPATSAPAERLASAAGNITTAKRNRLCPEKVQMLTLAAVNWSRFYPNGIHCPTSRPTN